jgi:hypothetical protein
VVRVIPVVYFKRAVVRHQIESKIVGMTATAAKSAKITVTVVAEAVPPGSVVGTGSFEQASSGRRPPGPTQAFAPATGSAIDIAPWRCRICTARTRQGCREILTWQLLK